MLIDISDEGLISRFLVCSSSQYKDFKNGKLFFDKTNDMFVSSKTHQSDGDNILSFKDYNEMNDVELGGDDMDREDIVDEIIRDKKEFTSKSGDKIIVLKQLVDQLYGDMIGDDYELQWHVCTKEEYEEFKNGTLSLVQYIYDDRIVPHNRFVLTSDVIHYTENPYIEYTDSEEEENDNRFETNKFNEEEAVKYDTWFDPRCICNADYEFVVKDFLSDSGDEMVFFLRYSFLFECDFCKKTGRKICDMD